MNTWHHIRGGVLMSEPTIREWARAQGMEVASRGLIPRHIIEAYKLAHGIGRPRPRPIKPFVHQERGSRVWISELPVLTTAGECVGWYSERFDQHAHAFTFALRGPLTVEQP
jgi:hypothetical protein